MSQPLLELDTVRIDCDGCCVLDAVTLKSSGDRIGLLGQGHHILDALSGVAEVTTGHLRIAGVEIDEARDSALYAVARPWTAHAGVSLSEGLVLSALLGGCTNADAKQRAERAIESLGLAHLSRQRFVRRPKVELYLAGLAEAALFDSTVVVVDWPIGLLDPDAWSRFGTVLARLIQHKRWIAWVPGPARLPVEQSWIGALDQLLWVESGMTVDLGVTSSERARVLLVLDVAAGQLPDGLDQAATHVEPIALSAPFLEQRAAFVVEVARDEFGRPDTEPLLAWCDDRAVPVLQLRALDQGL